MIGVEQRLHTFVLEGAPAKDWNEELVDGAGPNRLADLVGGDLELLEVLLEELLVGLGGDFEHLSAPLLGLGEHVGGDFGRVPHLAVVALPDVSLHSIRSMTPVKSPSRPIGIWRTSGLAPSRSMID